MIPTKTDYPVFEANQVLTNEHLNSVRTYLDEQNRLTRATLHGIGVVCGLDVSVGGTGKTNITISKGYGVTSEGYLAVVGNEDFVADRYQDYKVPNEDGYELFVTEKYKFWELLDTAHDDYDDGLELTTSILQGKVVLLFVELLEDNLKNCSPASCDDKGKKVDITLRKLLISEVELNKLHEKIAANLEKAKAHGDFFPDLTARLDLPDLRLPRLDVPASNMMVDAQTIFAAYRKILSPKILFERVGNALDDAYKAFNPILSPLPADNFLSENLTNIKLQYEKILELKDSNVIFSQYFYDFLDDIIQAYDEFRWKAVEFMALCSPPSELFPRHLELGETGKGNFAGKKVHRHYFRPSPALAEQKKLGEEVQLLFQRLRLMVESFKAPTLPKAPLAESSVKITPSKLGDVPLSEKAIPFYYDFKTSSSLPASWNYQKTRTGRPKAIPGYYVGTEYHLDNDPNLLNYDLEKYNFFRIEGHIGFEWRNVLKDLLEKIRQYRLPFDVITLNAHPSTATADVLKDPLVSHCLTNDLQVIFDAWAKELECLMGEKMKAITQFPLPGKPAKASPPIGPSATLIKGQVSPRINVLKSIETAEGTLGNVIAMVMKKTPTTSSATDKLKENVTAQLKAISEINDLKVSDYDVAIGHRLDVVMAMVDFSNSIPVNASDLKFTAISDKYKKLATTLTHYRDNLIAYKPLEEKPVITPAQKDQLLKELQDLLSNCLIKRLEGLGTELEHRNKQVEELIYFSKYLRKHPGLQHKAGVPKEGTFIVIFQEIPTEIARLGQESFTTDTLTGEEKPNGKIVSAVAGDKQEEFNIPERVVIADFFLPYRCCSDCPPVQFILPAARPIFALKPECSDEKDKENAKVRLEFTYRIPPCEVKIDARDYVALVDDVIPLEVGKHTVIVRDAEGGVSLPQEIEIFPPFTLDQDPPVCDNKNENYTVRLKVTNGQLPFFIRVGDEEEAPAAVVPNGANVHYITTGPFPSGKPVKVIIRDSLCRSEEKPFMHTCCDLPCDGQSRRCAYRLWIQPPVGESRYKTYSQGRSNIKFRYNGKDIPLPKTTDLLNADLAQLNQDFQGTIGKIINNLNDVINNTLDKKIGALSKPRLMITYEPDEKNDPFGVLWIEYFACETFNLEFTYTFAKSFQKFNLTWRYTNEPEARDPFNGAILINHEQNDKETRVPAIDCSERNQCTGSNYKKVCEGADLAPSFFIEPLGDNRFQFGGKVEPATEIAAWVWDVFTAQPAEPFYEGEKVDATLQDRSGLVRLTVITKKGCFGISDRRIEQ